MVHTIFFFEAFEHDPTLLRYVARTETRKRVYFQSLSFTHVFVDLSEYLLLEVGEHDEELWILRPLLPEPYRLHQDDDEL